MYSIAIDIGATNLRVASCDANGNVIKRIDEKIDKTKDSAEFLKVILQIIENIVTENGKPERIAIASAGLLNLKKGSITPINLPLGEIPIVDSFKKFTQEIFLMNDCDAGVIGEKIFGAGKNHDNLVYVTISTGIGSGIISHDKLLLGKDGNATEIGHTTIDPEGRMKCGCGKSGHWEAYCSGKNIPIFAKQLAQKFSYPDPNSYENKTSAEIFSLAKNDETTKKILDEIGRYNAIGLSNIINTFDPSLIVLGGSVAINNQKEILEPINSHLEKYTINRIPEIKITQLGNDVVLYGAIAVATGKFQVPKI